jgi:hypothetical protein
LRFQMITKISQQFKPLMSTIKMIQDNPTLQVLTVTLPMVVIPILEMQVLNLTLAVIRNPIMSVQHLFYPLRTC